MYEHRRPPPVGSNTFTQLIAETLRESGSMTIQALAGKLQVLQFYVLQHLWLLKLSNKHPDIIASVTNVSYDNIPASLRDAVAKSVPVPVEAPPPQPPVPTALAVEPEPVAATKAPPVMRHYGSLHLRTREFVDFVRSKPPKTPSQLAREFRVSTTTIRRYLYAMIMTGKNIDVARKTKWKGQNATDVPPSGKLDLERYPLDMVEYPRAVAAVQAAPAPQPQVKPPEPKQTDAAGLVNDIERLALRALRQGDTAAAVALGKALEAVEKNTTP